MIAESMNTICLLGSPRRDCNSDTLAKCFTQQAEHLERQSRYLPCPKYSIMAAGTSSIAKQGQKSASSWTI